MRTIAFIIALITAFLLNAEAQQISQEQRLKWACPNGNIIIRLDPVSLMLSKQIGDSGSVIKVSPLAEGDRRYEHVGNTWLKKAETIWLKDKFLIFFKGNFLQVVDVTHSLVLLNSQFKSLIKSPLDPKWVAIRLRAFDRHAENLDADYKDDLLLIAPKSMTEAANNESATATPFSQLISCELSGIAIAPAEWSRDGKKIICAVWHNNSSRLITYEGSSLKVLAAKEMPSQIDSKAATDKHFVFQALKEVERATADDKSPAQPEH